MLEEEAKKRQVDSKIGNQNASKTKVEIIPPLISGSKTKNANKSREKAAKKLNTNSHYVSDAKKLKAKRDAKIFELWMACHTQEEIAEAVKLDRTVVGDICKTFVETVLENQNHKTAADHATDFTPPIYNVWKQQTKTEGSTHFGNSEIRWLDNLLYPMVNRLVDAPAKTRSHCRRF
jgi:hypothetical protein